MIPLIVTMRIYAKENADFKPFLEVALSCCSPHTGLLNLPRFAACWGFLCHPPCLPHLLGCDPTVKLGYDLLVTTAGKLNFIFNTSLPFLLLICLAPSQSPCGFGFNIWP